MAESRYGKYVSGKSKKVATSKAPQKSTWERERAGIATSAGGLAKGLLAIFRDIGKLGSPLGRGEATSLLPGGVKPSEKLPALSALGPATWKSAMKTKQGLEELFGPAAGVAAFRAIKGKPVVKFGEPAVLPGGRKPSETAFPAQARETSVTETILEHGLNLLAPISLGGSVGAGALGAGSRIAGAAGKAPLAAKLARGAEATAKVATPLRSSLRSGATAAAARGMPITAKGLNATVKMADLMSNPIATTKAAGKRAAMRHQAAITGARAVQDAAVALSEAKPHLTVDRSLELVEKAIELRRGGTQLDLLPDIESHLVRAETALDFGEGVGLGTRALAPIGRRALATEGKKLVKQELKQVGAAQVEAARQPHVLAMRSARDALMQLPEMKQYKWAERKEIASQMVAKELNRRLEGRTMLEGLGGQGRTLPRNPELDKWLDRAEELARPASLARQIEAEIDSPLLKVPPKAMQAVKAGRKAFGRAERIEARGARGAARLEGEAEGWTRTALAEGPPISPAMREQIAMLQQAAAEARTAGLIDRANRLDLAANQILRREETWLSERAGAGAQAMQLRKQASKVTQEAKAQSAKEWARGQKWMQKALDLTENIDTVSTRNIPPIWQPLFEGVRDLRVGFRDLHAQGLVSADDLAALLAGTPQYFSQLMVRAVEQGINPVHVADLAPSKVKQLVRGNPVLGGGVFGEPGKTKIGRFRKQRSKLLQERGLREESVDTFIAEAVQVVEEARTNAVADSITQAWSRRLPPVDSIPESVAKSWVPWSPTQPVGGWEMVLVDGKRVAKAPVNATHMIPKQVDSMLKSWTFKPPPSGMLGTFDKVMSSWRFLLLNLSPRWYLNGLIGNTVISTVNGAGLQDWARSIKAMRKVEIEGQMVKGAELPGGLLRGNLAREAESPISRFLERVGLPPEGIARLNTAVDEYARVAVYFSQIRKGADVETAVSQALKAMVDYSDFTPLERAVGRRLIPFYAWQKGVMKMTAKLPVDHPLRTAVMMKIGQTLGGYTEEERQTWPDYLFASVDIGKGRLLGTRGMNPFQDALALSTPEGIKDSLNPAVEAVIRSLFNVPEAGFADRYTVNPIGVAEPDVTLREGLMSMFTDIPLARAASGDTSELLQLLGINIRSPEKIQKAIERTSKARTTQQNAAQRLQEKESTESASESRYGKYAR